MSSSVSLQFRSVLLEISNKLSAEQLDHMKYLCNEHIGKRDLEKISSAVSLFQLLTERRKLSAEDTDYVCQLLETVGRPDLSELLRNFDCKPENQDSQPPQHEKAKLDIATEVVAENLGRSWRQLGRKLGLSEVKLESIAERHPRDLEETAVELMKEWRKKLKAEARAEDVIKALRACGFNLTADKIEDRLSNLTCQ